MGKVLAFMDKVLGEALAEAGYRPVPGSATI
jgi:hypothetical protein